MIGLWAFIVSMSSIYWVKFPMVAVWFIKDSRNTILENSLILTYIE
jgi:hypothetical protein